MESLSAELSSPHSELTSIWPLQHLFCEDENREIGSSRQNSLWILSAELSDIERWGRKRWGSKFIGPSLDGPTVFLRDPRQGSNTLSLLHDSRLPLAGLMKLLFSLSSFCCRFLASRMFEDSAGLVIPPKMKGYLGSPWLLRCFLPLPSPA